MRYLLCIACICLVTPALAHNVAEINDANGKKVGNVTAHHHVGSLTIVEALAPACIMPSPACLPPPITEDGEFRIMSDLAELYHHGTVWFTNAVCGVGDTFYFNVVSNPPPTDPEGRSAMYADAEWKIADAPPAALPVYQSYRNPLGQCMTATGTAPPPLNQYRERVTIRRGYTPPYTLQ